MTNGTASETNGITSEVTLLPCPFCGGEAELYSTVPTHGGFWWCVCRDCGASTSFGSEAEAIATWNTRAEDTASTEMAQRIQTLELECAKLQEELREAGNRGECEMVTSGTPCEGNTDKRCTACGAYNIGEYYDGLSHIASPKFCPNCGRKVKR